MEILNEFGFKTELFIAQVVNFLILAYVFKRFLYKPLLTILKKRQATIQKGLADAQKSAELLEETENKKNEVLKKTRAEADEIIADAKKTADEIKMQVKTEAKADAEKIMQEAKNQAQLEMQRMQSEMKRISLDLSAQLLATVTKSLFTEEEKAKILKRTLDKLEKN